MCQKRSSINGMVLINGNLKTIRLDNCIKHLPFSLSSQGYYVVACCCGHGTYPLTVICKNRARKTKNHFDLISGKDIFRDKKFYKLNKKNRLYYIPEVSGDKGEITLR